MSPYSDGVERPEPIAPGQISEPDSYPIEPRCECGRLMDKHRDECGSYWTCPIHGMQASGL